jgi:thioester reductase-like protein
MGAVLLTGATGFVGREVLSRFLTRGDREVYALVRAADDQAAAERLPGHDRLTTVAGDIERSGLGLSGATAERLRRDVSTVVHCAASVSFELPLEESRRVNVGGTRNVAGFARDCPALERFTYVSTAYVAGEPGGLFREDELAVGQSFRNPYERSKFEAEVALRSEAGDLPLQILRPSIVVGDSTTGRTTSFNVLYGPLRAFARGAMRAIPARRDSPVDIVPVDYVADALVHLLETDESGVVNLVAGRDAATVDELIGLAAAAFERERPPVVPPGSAGTGSSHADDQGAVYFPYFDMEVMFDDARARALLAPAGISCPRLADYFPVLMDYANRAKWGKLALTREEAQEAATAATT